MAKIDLDFCAVQKGNVSVPIHFHINWTACNSPGQNLVKDQYQALLWRITSLIWKKMQKMPYMRGCVKSQILDPIHLRFTYLTSLNLVQFLTLILISLTFDSLLIWKPHNEKNSCSFMTCCNWNLSILLGLATSDCETNARPLWATPSLTA